VLVAVLPVFSAVRPVLSQAPDDDWPMLMHDAARSGYTPSALLPPSWSGRLNLKWKVGMGERVEEDVQPIVVDGTVYLGVMNGKFYAIDAETGQIDWVFQADGEIASTAAAVDGQVYFGAADGSIYALDGATGEQIWRYETGGPVLSSPAVVDDTLYIGSLDGALYALDIASGDLIWDYATNGRVISSPAVGDGRVYFGSEDMTAYCLDAVTGALVWSQPLTGVSMKGTYPALDVASGVVIFVTMKPGREYSMPEEGLPDFSGRDPLAVWREYYNQYPERQHLFFLDTETGEERWYIPLPIPYWGTIMPLIDSAGYAWLPASGAGGIGGVSDYDMGLNHDIRLWKVDLSSGQVTHVANQAAFMLRGDETGRHTMAAGQYIYTIDADVGVYDPITNSSQDIFGNSFHTHVAPLDSLPTDHPLRYGGSAWAGGLTSASPLVVAGGVGYYVSFGWLYAITPDPVASPGVVDLGPDLVSGPPAADIGVGSIVAELNNRVRQIVNYGHLDPEVRLWSWVNTLPLAFWFEGETVFALAQTMPYLEPSLQAELKAYLRREAEDYLFNPAEYVPERRCIEWEDRSIHRYPGEDESMIGACWYADDENLIGDRLYAMWAYAHYTGDWQIIEDNWDFILALFDRFVQAFDPQLGFAVFPRFHLNTWLTLHSQIGAMVAVSHMADHLGYNGTRDRADAMADQMFDARLRLGRYVPSLYDLPEGDPDKLYPQEIPLNPDGSKDYYTWYLEYRIIPAEGHLDRDNDPRQVIWMDSSNVQVDWTFHRRYVDMLGYRPLYPEVAEFLREHLHSETEQYVRTMTVNNPWWYWSDTAHETIVRQVEERYASPHEAFTIFQVKARVLGESFGTLRDQLPWNYAETGFRDIYRLQNLVALLQATATASKSVTPAVAEYGDVVTYTITAVGTGGEVTITDPLPDGLAYVPGSLSVAPEIGTFTVVGEDVIEWQGTLMEDVTLEISFAATVVATTPTAIRNVATVEDGFGSSDWSATLIANGSKVYLPLVTRGWASGAGQRAGDGVWSICALGSKR
jgi:uncharacterized repeat protein (TIGR01451 family)